MKKEKFLKMFKFVFIFLLLLACHGTENYSSENDSLNTEQNNNIRANKKMVIRKPRSPYRVYRTSEIMNANAEKVIDMLGEPELKRLDPPVEIWLYQREEGTLFVFFEKEENNDNNIIVKYIEARALVDDNVIDTDDFLKRNF